MSTVMHLLTTTRSRVLHFTAALALLTSSAVVCAQANRCEVNGVVTYSDAPCAEASESSRTPEAPPESTTSAPSSAFQRQQQAREAQEQEQLRAIQEGYEAFKRQLAEDSMPGRIRAGRDEQNTRTPQRAEEARTKRAEEIRAKRAEEARTKRAEETRTKRVEEARTNVPPSTAPTPASPPVTRVSAKHSTPPSSVEQSKGKSRRAQRQAEQRQRKLEQAEQRQRKLEQARKKPPPAEPAPVATTPVPAPPPMAISADVPAQEEEVHQAHQVHQQQTTPATAKPAQEEIDHQAHQVVHQQQTTPATAKPGQPPFMDCLGDACYRNNGDLYIKEDMKEGKGRLVGPNGATCSLQGDLARCE